MCKPYFKLAQRAQSEEHGTFQYLLKMDIEYFYMKRMILPKYIKIQLDYRPEK